MQLGPMTPALAANTVSPMSEQSNLGIEWGSVSIKSDGSIENQQVDPVMPAP
jgi:hypothetical protein